MIIIFLVLSYLYGYSILRVLSYKKIFRNTNLSFIELNVLSIPIGYLTITIAMLLLGLLNIKLSFITIWLPIFIQIAAVNILLKNKVKLKVNFTINGWNFFDILIGIILLNISIYAITNKPFLPDEFSHWALQAKNIFIGNKINLFINSGFENYPNYIPLIASSYYFLIGYMDDSSIRIISSIHLILLVINMYYFGNKVGINKIVMQLLIILFLTSAPIMIDVSSSFYADTIFASFYSIAIMYFLLWYKDQNKDYFSLSVIYMLGATWSKIDGVYLLLGQVVIMIIMLMKSRKFNYKIIMKYLFYSLWLIVIWRTYISIAEFPISRWSLAVNFEYITPMIKSMILQSFEIPGWGFINILFIGAILLNIKNLKSDEMIILLLVVIGNIIFLSLSYIFLFGGEALTAASYSRYISRIIPVQIMIIVLQCKNIDSIKN